MKKLIVIVCFICIAINSRGQTFESNGFGASVGLNIALGNRFDRIGITMLGYYSDEWYQINSALRVYYNFRNLGPSGKYWEWNPSLGAAITYGKKDADKNPFITSVSNQTGRKNSIVYSYNFYWNKIKTTQSTGTVSLQFNNFQIITENDFFSFSAKDQFRTGAFLLQYRYKDFQFGINATLWTGAKGKRVDDASFPSRLGYMDMRESLYGNLSHGLLSLQMQYAAPYGQTLQASFGVDAEQIRNALQNRMMHDLIFTPEKWHLSNNAHIPMIDSEGKMYLYKDDQRIRPMAFYFNLFLRSCFEII